LVLFFRKEQSLLFLKKKKQKDFYSWRCFTILALCPISRLARGRLSCWPGENDGGI
jgi:hypothetical protein